MRKARNFKGNIEYASLNQMNLIWTTRQDDLISMFYIMIRALNDNKIVRDP